MHIGSNTRKILKNAFSALPSEIGVNGPIQQTIKIDEGVEFIGNGAFSVYYNTIWVKQGELIIPASVITIESYAFKDIAGKYIVKGRTSIPSTWDADWCYSSKSGYPPVIEFQP